MAVFMKGLIKAILNGHDYYTVLRLCYFRRNFYNSTETHISNFLNKKLSKGTESFRVSSRSHIFGKY